VRVTYVGHATLLLQIAGRSLLTDPNFDPALTRVSFGNRLSRVSPPGVALGDLPVLDAVLITHAHADHLSFASLNALPPGVPLYAPPPVAEWMRRLGYTDTKALGPGGKAMVHDLQIAAAPAVHQGSR
jgi:L-ascorbate metabolism protein UlaG (beta-lactamase superfamily)